MRVLDPGHRYELDHRDGDNKTVLQFVNKEPGRETEGVVNQEVLRALIDRIQYVDNRLPHVLNQGILKHLRLALVLHESRALERKVVKGEIRPELIRTGEDGHYSVSE